MAGILEQELQAIAGEEEYARWVEAQAAVFGWEGEDEGWWAEEDAA